MIIEGFCSFEVAKLLKEKGFKTENTNWCYLDGNLVQVKKYINISPYEYAPTISQVLKWLREKKKIHLIVEISDSGWYYTYYSNIRWKGDRLKSDKYFTSFKTNSSYELAAIAGINYVIDNLI